MNWVGQLLLKFESSKNAYSLSNYVLLRFELNNTNGVSFPQQLLGKLFANKIYRVHFRVMFF